MTIAFTSPRTATSISLGLFLALSGGQALAQSRIKDVDPYYAIVAADGAGVRSGDHSANYVVIDLTKGQIVLVNGESKEYARVAYSPGWPAVVLSSDCTYDAASGTAKLKQNSTLRAFSAGTPDYCFQQLLPDSKPLASGTTLKVLATLTDRYEQQPAYKVVAPDSAVGYVEARYLRKATKEETEAYKAKPGATIAAMPGAAASPPKAPTPAVGSTPTPGATKPADRSLVEPQVKPGGEQPKPGTLLPNPPAGNTPAKPADNSTTTNNQPAGATPGAQPQGNPPTIDQGAKPDETKPATHEPTAAERQAASMEALEASFQKLNAKDVDIFSAEYEPLLAEINKASAALGETPADKDRKRQLAFRADMIQMRIKYRDAVKKIEEVKRSASADNQKVSKAVADAEKTRVYTMIGTLATSSVYDGKSLPQMYRLTAAGTATPITLGYISPEAALRLDAKVGQLVGVVGEAAFDPIIKLNIIKPTKIDLINASGQPIAPAAVTPPDTKKTETPKPSPEVDLLNK